MNPNSDPDPKLKLNASAPGRLPWYQDTRVIAILLLIVGLLALPLVWFNKAYTLQKKVLITVIAVTVAGILLVLMNWLVTVIGQREQTIQDARFAIVSPAAPAATAGSAR